MHYIVLLNIACNLILFVYVLIMAYKKRLHLDTFNVFSLYTRQT